MLHRKDRWAFEVAAVALVVGCAAVLAVLKLQDGTAFTRKVQDSAAVAHVKRVVTDRLLFKETAIFGPLVERSDGIVWTIDGTVSETNSSNQEVEFYYFVKLERAGEAFTIKEIQMKQR